MFNCITTKDEDTSLSNDKLSEHVIWNGEIEYILYGNALKIWLAKHDCLSEEEIALCYFCYIGVKHKNQSIFFGISLQSLSKRKQRLRAKLKIPRGMSFKDVVNAI